MNRMITLIPAYEPDEKLIVLLRELKDKEITSVVVNDGSPPGYNPIFEEAKKYGIVLSYEENRGKGAALKYGLSYIKEHLGSDDIVITADADGQHTPSDILHIGSFAAAHTDALVLGSRELKGKVPLRSRLGNGITQWVYNTFFGQNIRDTQTGLRAFSTKWIPLMISIEGERYEYEMNVLMYCAKHSFPIREVTIETIYIEGNKSSHFHTIRDSARIYREIIKFCASSFVSFLLDYAFYAFFVFAFQLLGIGAYVVFSNIFARIISGTFNYSVNKKIVFKSKERIVTSGIKYALLCIGILVVNTVILSVLTNRFGFNALIAKPMVETIMFLFSFVIQRTLVFPLSKRMKQIHIGKEATA